MNGNLASATKTKTGAILVMNCFTSFYSVECAKKIKFLVSLKVVCSNFGQSKSESLVIVKICLLFDTNEIAII